MIIIKKIILFLCLFFLFDTLKVDSNSEKYLLYDKNINEESYRSIYFDRINSNILNDIINKLDINVLSYIIDEEKYYARNIDELINDYISEKELNEKIYYLNNGILIDGINIRCDNKIINELEKLTFIY